MNVFRIVGDWAHVTAIVLLFAKIFYTRSCLGISGRSQLLFALVYLSRYADLWLDGTFYSLYNTALKIFFSIGAWMIVFFIFVGFRKTYQRDKDVFLTEILLFPCFTFALIHNTSVISEALWAFSISLEAVAILPQLYMIYNSKQLEKIILYYLIALGLYRTIYLANWVYRYVDEGHYDAISVGAGVAYSLIYFIAMIVFFCSGVKIVDEGHQTYLKRNIFLISTNEPLDTSNLLSDPICVEKNGISTPPIKKVCAIP